MVINGSPNTNGNSEIILDMKYGKVEYIPFWYSLFTTGNSPGID